MLRSIVAKKRCTRCGLDKPLVDFNWKDVSRDRRQSYCRRCMNTAWREWYAKAANRERHLAQVARRRRRRTERHRRLIEELKRQPCTDCKRVFPSFVMDFDHVAEKTGEVGRLVSTYGTDRLLAEIERCEVVCANCHRIRTFERMSVEERGVTRRPLDGSAGR
jgi:hypothetical protein